jgi:acetyl esterase/lipase
MGLLLVGCGASATGILTPNAGDAGGDDAGLPDSGGPDGDAGSLESVEIVSSCTFPSLPASGTINFVRDIDYETTADGQVQRLDVAWPIGGGSYPLVVLIHGGGWHAGDKGGYDSLAQMLAGLGYAAASLDYRLWGHGCDQLPDGGFVPSVDGGTCYPNQFPAAVEDIRCAVRWLKANAGSYGIDPSRVAALGSSAGGHLVSMLGTAADVAGLDGTCSITGSPSVNAVAAYFPPEDLRSTSYFFPITSQPIVAAFLGATPEEDPVKAALASPIAHVTPSSPPFLLLHSTADMTVPVEHSIWMQAALWDAGVPATKILIDGGAHGTPAAIDPEHPEATCTMLKFLRERLNP